MKLAANDLNSVDRIGELRSVIDRKPVLRSLYGEVYEKYRECLIACVPEGKVVELGAGASFVKEYLPETLTTDFLPYPGLDAVVDATRMPFEDQSLRCILMQNVFHHIPDAEAFFREADRCLKPGGRILIADQNCGWLSRFILKYLHHEPFDATAQRWGFDTDGPLSGANGALTWIVFKRDIEIFERKFPSFRFHGYRPHTPLRYWFAGGLKNWNLIPRSLFRVFTWFDRFLIWLSPNFGSFVYVELEKK